MVESRHGFYRFLPRTLRGGAATPAKGDPSDFKGKLNQMIAKRANRSLVKGELLYTVMEDPSGKGFSCSLANPELLSQESGGCRDGSLRPSPHIRAVPIEMGHPGWHGVRRRRSQRVHIRGPRSHSSSRPCAPGPQGGPGRTRSWRVARRGGPRPALKPWLSEPPGALFLGHMTVLEQRMSGMQVSSFS